MTEKLYLHKGAQLTADEVRAAVYEYYRDVFSNRRDRHVQMQRLLPPADGIRRVLDYGAGLCGVSRFLAERYGCPVDAVDFDENELEKGRLAYGESPGIRFLPLKDFAFPAGAYDLIFCSQVAEHVHNVGTFLCNLNRTLADGGHLLLGIPNIVNLGRMTLLLGFSEKRALEHSSKMLADYQKGVHHINGWDPIHFTTLAASCGLRLESYLPTEGIPLLGYGVIRRIPVVRRILPEFLHLRVPLLHRLSYTTFFLFRKERAVAIGAND